MRDVGIDAEWRVICPDDEFFAVTKRVHNAMQGQALELRPDEIATYLGHNRHCAAMLGDEWDIVVVHDPQPAALIAGEDAPEARFVWRCHIDTSRPEPAAWDFLRLFLVAYDAAVFTLPTFVPDDLPREQVAIIAPAIDPLTAKNRALPRHFARRVVAGFGVDLSRPLVVQVSRFDPWKDPLGLVGAWLEARERVPGLQLALVGAMADDDPEGWAIHEQLAAAAREEPDCYLLTNLDGVGPRGQRFPARGRRRRAEVAARGVRADGLGGALEGDTRRRRRHGRHPAADRRGRGRNPRWRPRGVRRGDRHPARGRGAGRDQGPGRPRARPARVPDAAARPRRPRPLHAPATDRPSRAAAEGGELDARARDDARLGLAPDHRRHLRLVGADAPAVGRHSPPPAGPRKAGGTEQPPTRTAP